MRAAFKDVGLLPAREKEMAFVYAPPWPLCQDLCLHLTDPPRLSMLLLGCIASCRREKERRGHNPLLFFSQVVGSRADET